jgi:hypothetical protein
MSKPAILLDTNVCDKVRNTNFGFDVGRIMERIRQNFRVVVSPQTLIEILKSIKDARLEFCTFGVSGAEN